MLLVIRCPSVTKRQGKLKNMICGTFDKSLKRPILSGSRYSNSFCGRVQVISRYRDIQNPKLAAQTALAVRRRSCYAVWKRLGRICRRSEKRLLLSGENHFRNYPADFDENKHLACRLLQGIFRCDQRFQENVGQFIPASAWFSFLNRQKSEA